MGWAIDWGSAGAFLGAGRRGGPCPGENEGEGVRGGALHSLHPPPASKSVEIGTFYLKQKKYKAALSRFQEAVQTDPLYAPAYGSKLGKVYVKLGLKKEALRAYKRHLELLPSAREAEKAEDVHKAIARLERELGSGKKK